MEVTVRKELNKLKLTLIRTYVQVKHNKYAWMKWGWLLAKWIQDEIMERGCTIIICVTQRYTVRRSTIGLLLARTTKAYGGDQG